jgi:hypothetical protein
MRIYAGWNFRKGQPYSDEEGKISIIRNASGLNTNHTTMLVDKHGDISAPTLCLWGVHDPWQTIADGERLSHDIPNERAARAGRKRIPLDSPRHSRDVRPGGEQISQTRVGRRLRDRGQRRGEGELWCASHFKCGLDFIAKCKGWL